MPRTVLILFLILLGPTISAQQAEEVSVQTFIYQDTLGLDFYKVGSRGTDAPLLVLVHGGGFYTGSRDGVRESRFCREMAKKGFAVASISYRLTRKKEKFGCDCPAEKKVETFVMAAEDLSQAMQFLDSNQSIEYDRDKVVLIGSSAGAETVLHAAFMNAHHDFRHIPRRQYAGVVSFAGALIDADYITANNAVPLLMFHGANDRLVPFQSDAHHYCDPSAEGYLMLDGSKSIADKLDTLGTSYLLAFDPNGGHDWSWMAFGFTDLLEDFINRAVVGELREQKSFRVQAFEESENPVGDEIQN